MSDNVVLLEIPCLGSPFKLGMLYDSTNSKLIQSQALWDDNALQKAQQDKPFIDSNFEVILDDSIASKCLHLGVSNNLKFSLMGGLVNVTRSAKYFTDRTSSRQQIRVTLQCKCTSRIEELDIQQLGPVQDPAVVSGTRATHVVTSVLYGLDAFLVFDRNFTEKEDATCIQEKMESNVHFLSSVYETGNTDLAEIDQDEAGKYKCKMYCDVALPESPSNFKEALRILEEHLFKLFRESNCPSFIPKKAWLYPIAKLDSSASTLVQEVREDNVSTAEKLIEGLHDIEIWSSDISKSEVCSTFKCFQEQLSRLRGLIKQFRNDLTKQLASQIPKVHSGAMNNDQLADVLKEISNSPFCPNQLSSLLNGMEQEIRAVTICLQNISSFPCVSSPDEIESLGYTYEFVISLELRVGGTHTSHLDDMAQFLQTKKPRGASNTNPKPWYKDSSKKRALQLQSKLFKEFAQANSDRENTTFVVSTSRDSQTSANEGAAIVLYAEDDPMDFQPPSKPGKPQVSKVSESEISLEWTKPKYGSTSVISYTVLYRSLKNPPEQWMIKQTSGVEESLTVDNLVPDSEYQFKVRAECKAGMSPISELSDGIKTNAPSTRGNLSGQKQMTQTAVVTYATAVKSTPPSNVSVTTGPKSGVIELQLPPSTLTDWLSSTGIMEEKDSLLSGTSGPTELQLPPSAHGPHLLSATGPVDGPLLPITSGSHKLSEIEQETMHENYQYHSGIPEPGYPHGQQSVLHSDSMSYYSLEPGMTLENPRKEGASFMPSTARRVVTFVPDPQSEGKLPIHQHLQQPSFPSNFGRLEKPTISKVTHKSVELKWRRPNCGANQVQYYSVVYCLEKDPDGAHKTKRTKGNEECITIDGLSHETAYIFKLQANFSSGISLDSEDSVAVETKSYLPERIRSKSKLIRKKTDQLPAMYELKKNQNMIDREKRVARFEIGEPIDRGNEKVLMVVGATGAGKTTLINGIANFMYGVQWEDDFRFVIVANEPQRKSQAHSQTNWITAYTLHRAKESPIPYSLTIIDTPGFGDTEGIERDKKIVDQIKNFFSIHPPNGVDVLHGIGFVAQASLARLSQSQKYIFDSILSIYGRDVASNIFMMTTFADGQTPPVLEAIKVAKIPYQSCFKFNNSALFVGGEDGSFDAMFWQMGTKSFVDFFEAFGKAEHRSLQLTREVLDEREQLENVLKELQPQIHAGLTKMDELQRVVQMLQLNKALIEQNKDFVFKVKVTKQKKVNTPPGRYTTNCLNCNYTCHDNCGIANNAGKKGCWAMDSDGDCRICPNKCIWSKHVNNPYIFKLYEEEEVRTSKELKDRYDTAREGESRAGTMIDNIKEELEQLEFLVLDMVDRARKSLMRLDEIALKPNPLSEVDYIDQLIASEKQQCKVGWMERVNAYKQLRKRASLVRKIKTHDPVNAQPLFSYLGEDGAGGTYCSTTMELLRNPTSQKKKPHWFSKVQFWK